MFRFLNALLLAAFCASPVSAADLVGRLSVVDGDTVDIHRSFGRTTRLRLIGIDAVETDQSCTTEQGAVFACGAWVTEQVRALYQGERARCSDEGLDRYGRTLSTCWVGGENINAALVASGLARTYREDTTYATEEKAAQLFVRGLWAMRMEDPAVHRLTRIQGRHAPEVGCTIKGNISANGRIYHMESDHSYDRTGIRPERGERWFCTEAEARAAGWRPARR